MNGKPKKPLTLYFTGIRDFNIQGGQLKAVCCGLSVMSSKSSSPITSDKLFLPFYIVKCN